ncbi:MAG: nuclear transport factor 2 family protein [Cyanobacteria bacterium J06627_8]
MTQDEQRIRQWFDEWIKATKEGNTELARSLTADNAIFLVPGAGQMDKESFTAAATATDPNTDFSLDCSIQEIEIIGDYAWVVATLSLSMIDKSSGSQSLMKGDSLSIIRRENGGWVTVREANTMVPVDATE